MADRLSGVVLLVLSLTMGYLSWKLPLGSFQRPGPGLYPLLLSLILAFLVLFLLASSGLKKSVIISENIPTSGKYPKKVFYILGSLLVYAFCFESLGFLFSTFLFFLLLKPVVEKKWGYVIIGAFLVTFFSYLIFDILLQSQLPKGFIKF